MKQVINPTVRAYSTHIQTTASGAISLISSGGRNFRAVPVVMLGALMLQFSAFSLRAQNCATSGTDNINANENTYYSGTQTTVNAGATSITLGAAGSGTNFGNTPIASGDIVLVIQMQGAQILVPGTTTNSAYGSGFSGLGGGFISTNLYAGKMEFAVATNAVPLIGGTLNLAAGLTNSYAYVPYGTNGQYTYQIVRVPNHYNIKLTGTITTPLWNGSTGGITVMSAVNQFNFNGQIVTAAGSGFRGGGGRFLRGASGSYSWKDYYSPATAAANGSKGEGIAGTPRYLNNNAVLKDNLVEGYPSGSYARGAPGNAGGGATDSNPASNDQNAGGGGGGNGGAGGKGGDGWYSFKISGGIGGTSFTTYSPTKNWYSPSSLIMGGGGGAGSSNDATGTPGGGFASSGAAGGGMVIINALAISGTGTVDASGGLPNNTVQIDGSGGGGAGGSILIYANSGHSGITATANGGNGADNYPGSRDATQHGPGGGGGGGIIFSNGTLNAASSVNGGNAGTSYGNTVTDNYGATAGATGILTQTFPFTQLPPNMEICQIQVLPATILNFNASYASSNNVKVSWTTTNEINAAYYEVERSSDGEKFNAVGQVNAGPSGNPVHNYSTNDQLVNVNSNIVYYRLRIVDQTGKFVYSKVIAVKLDQPETGFSIYPNPVDNYTILNLHSDKPSSGVLRVMDNSGRQILAKSIVVNNGNNSVMVDQLGYLPRGIYMVQVLLNNNVYNQKLLKK